MKIRIKNRLYGKDIKGLSEKYFYFGFAEKIPDVNVLIRQGFFDPYLKNFSAHYRKFEEQSYAGYLKTLRTKKVNENDFQDSLNIVKNCFTDDEKIFISGQAFLRAPMELLEKQKEMFIETMKMYESILIENFVVVK